MSTGNVQKHRWITQERVDKFLSDTYWTDCNLKAAEDRVARTGVEGLFQLSVSVVPASTNGRPDTAPHERFFRNFHEEMIATRTDWKPAHVGDSYGPLGHTFWFKVEIHVQEGVTSPSRPLRLLWHTGGEGLVHDSNGRVVCGISGEGRDFIDIDIESMRVLFIEMVCGSLVGDGDGMMIRPPNASKRFQLARADLVAIDPILDRLRCDLEIMYALATVKDVPAFIAEHALLAANDAVNAFRHDDESTFSIASRIVDDFFAQNSEGGEEWPRSVPRVHAIGHCHIDTAWLWRYSETRRKVVRSWASQSHLRKTFAFTFAVSQPQQMQFLEDHGEPAAHLSRELAQRKGAVFEPLGGTWVECDGNLPSGESFCRQFLLGQTYMKSKSGTISSVFWLPDTFGYAAQLPQIARHFGCKYFLSQKLSWNLTNKAPHTTFWWKGIDGTTPLLAHFPPADNYGCDVTVEEIFKMAMPTQHKDLGRANDALWLFGRGDGGGGPTKRMLQRLERFSKMKTLPVAVKTETSVASFFEQIEKVATAGTHTLEAPSATEVLQTRFEAPAKVLTHVGELYFEMHRGVLSTWRLLKHLDRLVEAELLTTDAFIVSRFIDEHTKTTEQQSALECKRQRHEDVLLKTPRRMHDELTALWKSFLMNQFHDVLPGTSIPDVNVDAACIYAHVFNAARALRGAAVASVPGTSVSDVHKAIVDASNDDVPENPHLLTATLPCEAALTLYEDVPLFWDAWDVADYCRQKPVAKWRLQPTTCVMTPLCNAKASIGDNPHHEGVTFLEIQVDWREAHKLLKLELYTNIVSPHATFGTAFGHVTRPTHENDSIATAKFESCMDGFVDLSEYGRGISVVSNCGLRGASVSGSVLSISLLRAPTAPDPNADRGHHDILLAIVAHNGQWQTSAVPAVMKELKPWITTIPRALREQRHAECCGLVGLSASPALAVSTIKLTETQCSFVVRIHECFGGHVRSGSLITFSTAVVGAFVETDGLEIDVAHKIGNVSEECRQLPLPAFSPFQIRTFRFDV